MNREFHILTACVLAVFVSLAGCVKTDVGSPVAVDEDGVAEYVLDLAGIMNEEGETGTKSILGTDSTTNPFIKDSGYQVFAFNRRFGVLEAVATVGSYNTKAILNLSTRDTYDFFVVGNLWFLSGSTKTGWDAMFKKLNKYPGKADDMIDASFMPYYRFDGQMVGSTGLRTETFAQVATYGIPYSGKAEGVTYANSRNGVSVSVKRLFSKVTLTVDHSGLVDADSADAFVNKSIHLRQVNCRVHPFITGIEAEAGDILSSAEDYEANPVNGASQTFVFYVPENYGGTYSVTKASDKTPSKAGVKSGLVTYLEFVGKLDPAKAGGYGGTLKYQFCLGGNATTNYNVVRNNNYKVKLGFKASSIFEGVDWKMDVDGSLTDTRVLGLSADVSGSQRLDETGNQIVAVRPSNTSSSKRSLYVFFNHSGGTANEWSSYIDPYTAGWTPSSAKRSAVKVSSPDMSADGITYSLDQSTGMLSFWTTKPTAMVTGRTYTLTLTLMPKGQSKSFKVKVYPDIKVSANVSNLFVGMKRNISASGFVGSNVTMKVKSGGGNILRYSNSAASDGGPGTDKYVTSEGVNLSGMSVPLYAYRPGSVTLAVSSEDTFNDSPKDIGITVRKPVPYYDDIRHEVPVWDPQKLMDESKSVIIRGFCVVLPFDGTPITIPAHYISNPWYPESSKITIGPGENQFDPEVYKQLLAFVFDFSHDCYGQDPNTMQIYLKSWKAPNGKYFGIFSEDSVITSLKSYNAAFSVNLNHMELHPRSTEIFPTPDDDFYTWLGTSVPGFYDMTEYQSEKGWKKLDWKEKSVTSGYFNHWDSGWSAWKTNGEIDTDVIRARWPKITNEIGFSLAGSQLSSVSFKYVGDHDATLPQVNDYFTNGIDGTGDFITFKWKYAPGELSDGITDTKGAVAPYGKQKLTVKVTNMHSHETLEVGSPEFDLKYENVKLSSYMFGTEWENEAEYYVAAPSVLAWLLYEKGRSPYYDPYGYSTTMPNPLYAFDDNYIVCDSPVDLVQYGGINNVQYSEHRTAKTEIHAKFPAWKRAGGYPERVDDFDDTTWNAELMQWWFNSDFALPRRYAFTREGIRSADVPRLWYSNTNLYDYIRFSYDRVNVDDEIRRLGYNIY